MLCWVTGENTTLHVPTMHTSKSCEKMSEVEAKLKAAVDETPPTEFPPPGYRPTPINQLLVNALDLTVPASDVVVKTRKSAWVQVAGHPGSFAPASQNTIWKKRLSKENYETKAYHCLMNDVVRDVVPRFHREVEYSGEIFIEIEDLLQHFSDPSIMDIKMGTRTFMESEVKNEKLRPDLFEKMIKINPDEPTAEEQKQRAITKLRYMQFRERDSSTSSLGFRLEAIKMPNEEPNADLKKIKTEEQVKHMISLFLQQNRTVQKKLLKRFKEMRRKIETSKFFKHHEVIGSSVLILYDKTHASAWLIDFAKTLHIEDGTLDHRTPWQLGNHEDGYLTGIDNLIRIFSDLDLDKYKTSDTFTVQSPNDTILTSTRTPLITVEHYITQQHSTDCQSQAAHLHNGIAATMCMPHNMAVPDQCLLNTAISGCASGTTIVKSNCELRVSSTSTGSLNVNDINSISVPQVHAERA